ncbi:MAG: hydroxyacylglutathione hydrolase [Benjaminiella poitrasii]|nr:MAG: hydroxyacylglutathione hydrolase [Benjaminiella poitrasii]
MKIIPVPALEDNYSYILIDDKSKEAAVIDPVEPIKILNVISQTGAKLSSVFVTHHHWDHTGRNIELPGLAVYGADARIPEINYVCKDHEEFKLGSLEITPLHTPCHTKGHVCYYVADPNTNEKALFSGEDMYCILFHIITKLPDDTWVYCGHEYTKKYLKVCATYKQITVPSTIGQEKLYNPFLRVNEQWL